MIATWLLGSTMMVSQVGMAPAPLPSGVLLLVGAAEEAAPSASGAADAPQAKTESSKQSKGAGQPPASPSAAAKAAAARAAAAKAAAGRAASQKPKPSAGAPAKVSSSGAKPPPDALAAKKKPGTSRVTRRRSDPSLDEEGRRAALREAAKHERIAARIRRLHELAAEARDETLGEKAKRLQQLEDLRHSSIVNSLGGLSSGEEDVETGADDPQDVDEEHP